MGLWHKSFCPIFSSFPRKDKTRHVFFPLIKVKTSDAHYITDESVGEILLDTQRSHAMTRKTQTNDNHISIQSSKNKTRHRAFALAGNLNSAILEGFLLDMGIDFDRPDAVEESIDDTFNKSDYDIQIEADEFLQTRIPLFSQRHPSEL